MKWFVGVLCFLTMRVEYMILYAETPGGLTAKVTAATAENWRPKGGVAVTTMPIAVSGAGIYTNTTMFYQAVVREGGPAPVIPTSALYV